MARVTQSSIILACFIPNQYGTSSTFSTARQPSLFQVLSTIKKSFSKMMHNIRCSREDLTTLCFSHSKTSSFFNFDLLYQLVTLINSLTRPSMTSSKASKEAENVARSYSLPLRRSSFVVFFNQIKNRFLSDDDHICWLLHSLTKK